MVLNDNLAGEDQGRRALPGLNQTAFYKQFIKTLFFHKKPPYSPIIWDESSVTVAQGGKAGNRFTAPLPAPSAGKTAPPHAQSEPAIARAGADNRSALEKIHHRAKGEGPEEGRGAIEESERGNQHLLRALEASVP
jgi:hypothetical protein